MNRLSTPQPRSSWAIKKRRHALAAMPVLVLIVVVAMLAGTVYAHGPEGDHDHAAADAAAAQGQQPVIEAHTEMFELVGTLAAGELSVMVDRYATNDPVTEGTLEVEFNGIRASGKLHADAGDFAFTDEALLRALREPGTHPLVFTLVAGGDSDLMEGTLQVAADAHAQERWLHGSRWLWVGLLVLAIAVLVSVPALARRLHRLQSSRREQP
ncbi:hypothetical protein CURE108131_04095 [Cupriavidus respiraculi]|uniref:Transmembrane protein n=1 Tax=Cupriavidus respiraculi TaxID=195930 RepID=A0ABM8WIM9_9BURK|nr:hypothetical protein [Cupriavidus respiraculi]CAG9167218.1 hypothetical protein LMG21510_00691 [Cupriavidus respiraculi]